MSVAVGWLWVRIVGSVCCHQTVSVGQALMNNRWWVGAGRWVMGMMKAGRIGISLEVRDTLLASMVSVRIRMVVWKGMGCRASHDTRQHAHPSLLVAFNVFNACLAVLLVCLLELSISRWNAVDIFNLTPVEACRAYQKWLRNSLSWSLTISSGKPFSQHQLLKKILASSQVWLSLSLLGWDRCLLGIHK